MIREYIYFVDDNLGGTSGMTNEEVVRCKDCQHAQDDVFHLFCELRSHKVMMDDYCSFGKRREE